MKLKQRDYLLIGIAIIALVLGAYYMTQPLLVFVSPATQYSGPGEKVTYEFEHFNQYSTEYDFHTKAYIGDTEVGSSSYSRDLATGEYATETLVFVAPHTPGTYTVEFYSYYGPNGGWDSEYFGKLIVSSTTPTEKPTEKPTPDPCAGVSCNDYCAGTMLYTSGVCVNGQCNYQTQPNSVQCGYETPTPTLTPTVTPTGTPPNGNDDTEDDVLIIGGFMIGIIGVLALLFFAIKARK